MKQSETQPGIDLDLIALQFTGEHLDEPAQGRDLATAFMKLIGLTDAEIDAAKVRAKATGNGDPLAHAIADATSPEAVAEASRKIAHLLVTKQINPDQGRTTLYALQVCLSALRFSEAASQAKAKEKKPRETETRETKKRGAKP